jgi:hypothetical protein
MELDKFISQTLNSIVKGIKDSEDFARENGARINPHVGKWDQDKISTTYFDKEEGAKAISRISFDIAVTAANEQEVGGQGGINVLSLKLGGKLSDKETEETVSRIQFNINVALPSSKP